jgi:deoxyribonuclease-4
MTFGAHESIAGGVFTAIERGQRATCDTVQIFNKSNHQWKARPLPSDEVDRFFSAIEDTGITVACSHTSYLINIGSPDRALRERSRRALRKEVERCNLLRIPNLVFHPGAHVGSGEEKGLRRIADEVNRVLSAVPDNRVTLCLETTAGAGTTLGHTFEQLADLIGRVEDTAHVGVCVDSCHIFAAGYALTPRSGYLKTMRNLDRTVGLDRVRIVHTNDSKQDQGSRKDRHAHIGKGKIGLEGFRHIVNDRRLRRVPFILETPKGEDLAEDVENLKVLRSLVKRR